MSETLSDMERAVLTSYVKDFPRMIRHQRANKGVHQALYERGLASQVGTHNGVFVKATERGLALLSEASETDLPEGREE